MIKGENIDQIRSFIAIQLPEPVMMGLKRVQEILKSSEPSFIKWVDPEGIHLTLKFLGNVPAGRIEQIIKLIEAASQDIGPFNLELKGLGAFPHLKRVQIVWVGINGDLDILQLLQKNLENNLSKIGFPPENRVFTPHLTLARVRDYASPLQRQSLGESIARLNFNSDLVIKVNSISLMRSQLTRSGAVYTELASIQLKNSC